MLLKNMEIRSQRQKQIQYSLKEDLIIIVMVNADPERYESRGWSVYDPIQDMISRFGFYRSSMSVWYRTENILTKYENVNDIAVYHDVSIDDVIMIGKQVVKGIGSIGIPVEDLLGIERPKKKVSRIRQLLGSF